MSCKRISPRSVLRPRLSSGSPTPRASRALYGSIFIAGHLLGRVVQSACSLFPFIPGCRDTGTGWPRTIFPLVCGLSTRIQEKGPVPARYRVCTTKGHRVTERNVKVRLHGKSCQWIFLGQDSCEGSYSELSLIDRLRALISGDPDPLLKEELVQ